MIHVTDNTILVGTAELRKDIPKLTKEAKLKTVIITKKGKPVAVLEDFNEYKEKERAIEVFEDVVLGYLAKERDEKTKSKDYISEKEMAKKFGVEL